MLAFWQQVYLYLDTSTYAWDAVCVPTMASLCHTMQALNDDAQQYSPEVVQAVLQVLCRARQV